MNLRAFDLNLLPVFRTIYRTRSVTLAGEQLHMTQSAVSNALKRLRESFGDPLFVRTHTGMAPTAMATLLIANVEGGLLRLHQAIDQVSSFIPAESDRLFRIAINDIGQLVLMPTLMRAVRETAPGVRIETVEVSDTHAVKKALVDGTIDLAVGSWGLVGAGFYQQKLFDETFVAVVARDHGFESEQLTIEDYLAAEHVTYRPSGASDDALQASLAQNDLLERRRVVLKVAHSLGLAAIVASSRLLLTVQARLGRAMCRASDDLRLLRLPFEVEPFPIRQQWHERFHADRGNEWLRQLAYDVLRNVGTPGQ